jgi:hypothetical protein
MAGQLTIAPFPAVTIDPHRDGDIGWTQNPFHNPTWEVDFQNGQWIEALVKAYLAGGPGAAAYRDRAQALLLGWLSHVPTVNKSPDTLICSAEAFPGQSWIHDRVGADGQFFEFGDIAFGGHPRYRSVHVGQDPDLVLVFDRASGAARYRQLWHLDPGLTVTTVTRSYAIATAPGTQLEIRQIPLPGQQIPAASTQMARGWVSHAALQRIPAPVVT